MVSLTYFDIEFGSSNKFILIDLSIQSNKSNENHNLSSGIAQVKGRRSLPSTAGVLISKDGTNPISSKYKGAWAKSRSLTGKS